MCIEAKQYFRSFVAAAHLQLPGCRPRTMCLFLDGSQAQSSSAFRWWQLPPQCWQRWRSSSLQQLLHLKILIHAPASKFLAPSHGSPEWTGFSFALIGWSCTHSRRVQEHPFNICAKASFISTSHKFPLTRNGMNNSCWIHRRDVARSVVQHKKNEQKSHFWLRYGLRCGYGDTHHVWTLRTASLVQLAWIWHCWSVEKQVDPIHSSILQCFSD